MATIKEMLAGVGEKIFGNDYLQKSKEASNQELGIIPSKYSGRIKKQVPYEKKKEIERYRHIFNNSPKVLDSYINDLLTEGKADIKDYLKFAHPEDKGKFLDYGYDDIKCDVKLPNQQYKNTMVYKLFVMIY